MSTDFLYVLDRQLIHGEHLRRYSQMPQMIVDNVLAGRLWQSQDPIGRTPHLHFPSQSSHAKDYDFEVVGIVTAPASGEQLPGSGRAYLALGDTPEASISDIVLVVRWFRPLQKVPDAVSRELHAIYPRATLVAVDPGSLSLP